MKWEAVDYVLEMTPNLMWNFTYLGKQEGVIFKEWQDCLLNK